MKALVDTIKKKICDKDIEFFLFVLFFISMSVYYGFRLFKFAPWYDELYTYNYFISNGPVYSAIHWPVPNNHIGYSVLSGFVYIITHNAFISLRGVSYVAALINLILIFVICRKLMPKGFSVSVALVYSGMWLVNNLAVQGRGYTLATTMMLVCVFSAEHIIMDEEVKNKYYFFWTLAMAIGLYIVSSSLYWVIPVCIFAGSCLILFNKKKRLIKLILFSVVSALITFVLYLIVWLAIGSNLLIKEQSEVYGAYSHVKLIMSHPVKSASCGIEYMLASPYIQSVSRQNYFSAFTNHWNILIEQMYSTGTFLLVVLALAVLSALVIVISRTVYICKNGHSEVTDNVDSIKMILLAMLILCFVVLVPLIVILQCKLPYFRVFSFYGFFVALSCVFLLYLLFGRLNSWVVYAIPLLMCMFAFAQLCMSDYNTTYGAREQSAYDLMKTNDLSLYSDVAITDCNQEYMYKFVYGVENLNRNIEQSQAVIIEKNMLDPDADYFWEFYYDYSTLPLDVLESMNIEYENEYYLLYVAK